MLSQSLSTTHTILFQIAAQVVSVQLFDRKTSPAFGKDSTLCE